MALSMPVKNVKRFKDRHGRMRHYHRPSGKPIKAAWGTPEFLDEVKTLNGLFEKKLISRGTSLKAVFDEYRTTPGWTTHIAEATRKGYEKYFALLEPAHDWPIKAIESGQLAVIRDRLATKRGSRTANYVLSVLSVIFGFAIERGYVSTNPVKMIKRARRERDLKRANRPWTIEEAKIVLDEAPWPIKVPVAIAMYTGLRKRDALTLTKQEVHGSVIETSKTGEEVTILIHPELAEILAQAPVHKAPTLAATSRGTTWSSSGFDSVWDRFKTDLENQGKIDEGLTMHGLRHTVGGLLADAGCDLDTIRRVLGQKTLTMAQLYSERAKKRNATRDAMARLDPLGNRPAETPEMV